MTNHIPNKKMAIATVGNVSLDASGTAVAATDWQFYEPALAGIGGSIEMEVIDGVVGGWTAFELHAIAHGVPCGCPVGQAITP